MTGSLVLRSRSDRVHHTFAVDLPCPRRRTAPDFQAQKQLLLEALGVAA